MLQPLLQLALFRGSASTLCFLSLQAALALFPLMRGADPNALDKHTALKGFPSRRTAALQAVLPHVSLSCSSSVYGIMAVSDDAVVPGRDVTSRLRRTAACAASGRQVAPWRSAPGSAARPCRVSGPPRGGSGSAVLGRGRAGGTRAAGKGGGRGFSSKSALLSPCNVPWGDVPAEWFEERVEDNLYWRSERVSARIRRVCHGM